MKIGPALPENREGGFLRMAGHTSSEALPPGVQGEVSPKVTEGVECIDFLYAFRRSVVGAAACPAR